MIDLKRNLRTLSIFIYHKIYLQVITSRQHPGNHFGGYFQYGFRYQFVESYSTAGV